MAKFKDIWLMITDVSLIIIVVVGIILWVRLGIFYEEYPIPFVGAIGQLACFYIWIRVRTISEFISQRRIHQINFYGLFYSILHSVYAWITIFFNIKKTNGMYQSQVYFFAYLVCWLFGVTQILIYALCHQTLTGVNYAYFHRTRDISSAERETIDEIDEYLVGLSDSSDSRGENSGEEKPLSFEELKLYSPSVYSREEKASDEFWSVWLDPLLPGEKIVQTLCSHSFHKRWLRMSYERGSDLCPNWRKSLTHPWKSVEDTPEMNGLLNQSNFTRSSFQSTDAT